MDRRHLRQMHARTQLGQRIRTPIPAIRLTHGGRICSGERVANYAGTSSDYSCSGGGAQLRIRGWRTRTRKVLQGAGAGRQGVYAALRTTALRGAMLAISGSEYSCGAGLAEPR